MSLPEEWVAACHKSEDRLKNHIPIEAINPTLCMETQCPAARVYQTQIPNGTIIQVWCSFSKCIHRLPEKQDLKMMK